MLKAILEFNLPEDKSDFTLANHAMDFYSALHDIMRKLRDLNKYGHDFKDPDEAVEKIYKMAIEEVGELLDLVE